MPYPEEESFAASVDAAASGRWLRLSAEAAEPAWLHEEVGRRLLERIEVLQLPAVAHYANWHWPQGGQALQTALGQRWPQAQAYAPSLSPASDAAPPAAVEKNRPLAQPLAQAGQWLQQLMGKSAAAQPQPPLRLAPAPGSVQLLVANMFLHHSANPEQSLKQWHESLAVGGVVFFTCFGPDTLKPLQQIYARLGWPAPLQRLVDMHDWGDALVNTGLDTPVMEMETLSLSYSSAQALLDELRTLGRNLRPTRFQGLRGRAWQQRLLAELEALKAEDGRIHMPFEIIYAHAFKSPPRAQISISKRKQLLGE